MGRIRTYYNNFKDLPIMLGRTHSRLIWLGMTNRYGTTLDPGAPRWAAAEGVSETVIAAVRLLHERSVNQITAKLTPGELEQVIKIVGRSPSCYPPGAYAALKAKRDLSAQPPTENLPPNVAAKEQAGRTHAADDRRQRQTGKPSGLGAYSAAEPSGLGAYSAAEGARDHSTTESGTCAGTPTGTRAETARRRMLVEDLRKAGLSIRTIAAGTGIPRSSVHRAMRAIAKAQAKQEIAIARIAQKLLGKKVSHRGRGRP